MGWMPHGGLALANSIATTIEVGALLALMRRRLGGLEGRRIWEAAWKAAAAAGVMGLGLWWWLTFSYALWLAMLGIAFGAFVYGAALVLLNLKKVRAMADFILKRLRSMER
jgi:putative peptidoglycan lipid II flippase